MLFLGPDRRLEEEGRELYGMDIGQRHTPQYPNQQLAGSAYWVPEETFHTLLDAALKQIRRAGFRIVVGHGHGPSTHYFAAHADEWRQRHGLDCLTCWGSEVDREGLGIQVDHAAMNETSLVMALHPDLVDMDALPADPEQWPLAIGGKDPRVHASAALGREIIDRQKARMASLLREALAHL
jgi:creatinine amidohydrolase